MFCSLRAFAKSTPDPSVVTAILGGKTSPAVGTLGTLLSHQPLLPQQSMPTDTGSALDWIASQHQRIFQGTALPERASSSSAASHVEAPASQADLTHLLDQLHKALVSNPPSWFTNQLQTLGRHL